MGNTTITGGNIELIKNSNLQAIQIYQDESKQNNKKTYLTGDVIGLNSDKYTIELFVPPVSSGYAGISLSDGTSAGSTHIYNTGITTPKLTQTSLKSKKKNIKKLKINALELIQASNICLYNLKGEKAKAKKHIGLVIGEGYNCPEEIISEDGQGVEPYSMTSLAWKAIQELIMQNEEKDKKIENLIKRVEKLEAK